MARCAAAGRGVTTVPDPDQGPNLYCSADGYIRIREIGVFNTTATAFSVGVGIATTAGTQAGALTEICEEDAAYTVKATGFTSQSAGATITALVRQASIGAAIGAGVIWTFGENGLYRPEGTGNGVVLTCPAGTGQFFDFYFVWDE